jgi:flagellar motor switch/type III secretory pathway protein FliN
LNQAEVSHLSPVFPELALIRQKQIDWCLSKISRLVLNYDCTGKHISAFDRAKTSAALTRLQSTPIGDFEAQLYGLTTDAVTTWSEYWEQLTDSAVRNMSDSIKRDSEVIAGVTLPASGDKAQIHYFELTGTPFDRPVILAISCRPGLGFKPSTQAHIEALPIRVKPYLEVGNTSVPINQFEGMKIGGLLVLRKAVQDGVLSDARILLAPQQYMFSVSWNLNEGIILVTDTELSASDANDSQPTGSEAGGMAIPIYAQIELRSVALDKLKSLTQEDTLEAGVFPKDAIVKLSAGSVAFGEGQLVQIEGRLAVRITKLNRRSA